MDVARSACHASRVVARRPSLNLLVVVAGLLGGCSSLPLSGPPADGERHISIIVVGGGPPSQKVTFGPMFTLTLDSRAAVAVRRRFDRDADGSLSPDEADRMAQELGRDAVGGFAVRCDGKTIPMHLDAPRIEETEAEGGLVAVVNAELVLPGTDCEIVAGGSEREVLVSFIGSEAYVVINAPKVPDLGPFAYSLPSNSAVHFRVERRSMWRPRPPPVLIE